MTRRHYQAPYTPAGFTELDRRHVPRAPRVAKPKPTDTWAKAIDAAIEHAHRPIVFKP